MVFQRHCTIHIFVNLEDLGFPLNIKKKNYTIKILLMPCCYSCLSISLRDVFSLSSAQGWRSADPKTQ